MIKPFLAALLALPLSGCIAWEIRDEVRTTNQHLCEVTPALGHTIAMVEETNQKIEQTNARMVEVQREIVQTQAKLERVLASMERTDEHLVSVGDTLVRTNPKLTSLDGGLEQMKILKEVHASLKEVNAALAPLSKTMGTLGGAMSLIGMGESSGNLLNEEAEDAAEPSAGGAATGGAEGGTVADGKPAAKGEAAGAAVASAGGSRRPDPLLGTWVQVYPAPVAPETVGRIVVIMGDGKFITTVGSKPIATGTWKRKDRTLTSTYDPTADGKATAPEVREMITLTSRTMTLRRGNEILVFARP